MTIRLLCDYDKYPANAIIILDAGTELGLTQANMASTDLTGGTVYVTPSSAPLQPQPLMAPVLGGVGVNTGNIVNSVGAAIVAIRPLSIGLPNAPYDSSTFRQIFQVPFTGKCLVRLVTETTTSTATTIDAMAVSAGRRYLDDDPVKADGTGGDWTVFTNVAVSAASATVGTDGLFGSGRSGWALVDIPAPTDGGPGGYIYTGVKLAGGTRLGMVGNGGTRNLGDWESAISGLLPTMKYRALRRSSLDFVNSNQNTMGANGPAYNSQFMPVTHIEIVPIRRVISGANFGDSTSAGLGVNDAVAQPYNYNWAHIAAHRLMKEQGKLIHIANFAQEGKTTAFNILGRAGALLDDPEFCPSFIIIQPFSINDGSLTDAIVNAGITTALNLCLKARKRGIIPILRTVLPSAGASLSAHNARSKGNAAILASGEVVIDLDGVLSDGGAPASIKPGYVLSDGIHLNRYGNEAGAPECIKAVRRVFFE